MGPADSCLLVLHALRPACLAHPGLQPSPPLSPPSLPAPACRVQLLGKKQALQEALQGLQVALCGQAKLQAQQELLRAKLERLGPGEPPPVLLLQDDRHSTSSSVSRPLAAPAPPALPAPSPPGAARLIFTLPLPPQARPPADVCPWPQEQEREGGRTPTLEILKSHISGIFRPKFSVSGFTPPPFPKGWARPGLSGTSP